MVKKQSESGYRHVLPMQLEVGRGYAYGGASGQDYLTEIVEKCADGAFDVEIRGPQREVVGGYTFAPDHLEPETWCENCRSFSECRRAFGVERSDSCAQFEKR
jgi:hypothetical protein